MVDRYIKELLIECNRVIVPDFGAFIARVITESKEPNSLKHKTIVFNDILKFNDGLLVNYIIKVENTDLATALQKIADFIKQITDDFVKGNDYLLEGIGQLHRDKRGNITLISTIDNLDTLPANILEVVPVEIEKEKEKKEPLIIQENLINLPLDPPSVDDKVDVVPPPIPIKEEAIVPPPIPLQQAEEISVPLSVVEEDKVVPQIEIKEAAVIVSEEKPVIENKKEEKPVVSVSENQISEPIKKESVKPEESEQKEEKKTPEIKAKPIKSEKPVKKEVKPQKDKKKSPMWISIVVWSVSGLLFLSLIFTASVKFGFIKGVKLFKQDEWISVNDKLHKDLEDFNKKHKDNLTLPEVNKDDNNKGAFSGAETESTGSFDEPVTNDNASDNSKTTTSSSSEGSFGSFDTPTDTKTTNESAKENKEKKSTITKADPPTNNTQSSAGSNSVGATGKYVLVAGSFSNKNAADIFIQQIKNKGFTSSEYVGVKNGMHMVCYGSYNDQKEANAEFQKLRQKGVQTWMLKQ